MSIRLLDVLYVVNILNLLISFHKTADIGGFNFYVFISMRQKVNM